MFLLINMAIYLIQRPVQCNYFSINLLIAIISVVKCVAQVKINFVTMTHYNSLYYYLLNVLSELFELLIASILFIFFKIIKGVDILNEI